MKTLALAALSLSLTMCANYGGARPGALAAPGPDAPTTVATGDAGALAAPPRAVRSATAAR